jgi:hypothetical protein
MEPISKALMSAAMKTGGPVFPVWPTPWVRGRVGSE